MTPPKNHKPVTGLDDVFGLRARSLRELQVKLLALYHDAGFEEVIPPLVERPESLKIGAGHFLADQTVIFSDPAESGQLAIRPDITPQIARIVATRLRDLHELRLCYSGPVMLARPEVRSGSRQQWQTGVELMGVAGREADVEIMHLAALSMHTAGFDKPILLVGHMGLLQALVKGSATDLETWAELLARRSPDDMKHHLDMETLPEKFKQALLDMAARVDRTWLASHQASLGEEFEAAAKDLLTLVDEVESRLSGEVEVHLDAAVMPRFLYHSGIVFAGFAQGASQPLLNGGRYDAMMASHGRDMPATGFSFDLLSWLDARPATA